MVEAITRAAFFEKVDRLTEEGGIKVELSNYRGLEEKMTFCCKKDGYFQMTPARFMRNSLGCALCSSREERKGQGGESLIESPEGDLYDETAHGISDEDKGASASSIERFMNYFTTQARTFDSEQPANLYYVKIKDDEVYMLGVSNKLLRQQYPSDIVQQNESLLEVTFANGEEAELMRRAISEKFSSSILDVDSSSTLCVCFFEDLSDEIRKMLKQSILMVYL